MSEHTISPNKSVLDELGLSSEDAENLKIRAKLMDSLIGYIVENDLNQTEAAERFGVQQGRVSLLMNGRISKFTIDALINMHSHAGMEVRVEPLRA